jgi:hypothetical protein
MTLDIKTMLAEWRQQRRLDYRRLEELIERGVGLITAGKDSAALNVLGQISEVVHVMQTEDTKRFFLNGMTNTPELKNDHLD